MPPRGLFLLAEIAIRCLFSTAETPLQIQRFPSRGFRLQELRDRAAHELPRSPAESGRKGCLPAHSATGMQSCSTSDPHCSPAGPTLLQRKQHFHCSQQKVTTCKPTCSCPLRGFTVHTEGFQTAHSRVREIPGQHLSPEELPLPHRNRTQHLFLRGAQPACEKPRAAGHAPSHRPARKPGAARKSPQKQQLPQDREGGKGGSSLPGNLCSHLHLCCSSALPRRRAQ